jgi:signal transduction histidine kinase
MAVAPPPRSPDPVPPIEPSFWRIVADAIRTAPKSFRPGLVLSPLPIVVAVVAAIGDIIEGTNALELSRLLGLFLASVGYTILLVTHVLHYISQNQEVTACGTVRGRMRWPFAALKSQVPHRILQALPTLALISAAFSAMAIGLYVPSFFVRPWTLILLPMFLWMLWLAYRTAGHTSHFLYGYAEQQAAMAARAREEATEAQLAALQAQMNPHFLFNALNTVASLVRSNPEAAESTVEYLSDVLRRTLARSSRTTGTVAEEVDYLEAYLAVEQQRFGERLVVEWDIAPELMRCQLPPLALQPLVENALRHGLGARLEGGHLRVAGTRNGTHMYLTVSDDGAGLPNRVSEGTGLGNLRRRLQTLYGDGARLWFESNGPGTTVRLELPIRE